MKSRMASPNMVVSVVLCFLLVAVIVGGCRTAAPTVVSTQPAQGATAIPVSPASVRITFDQPMVPSSVESAFSIRPSVGTETPTFAWSQDNRVVVVTFPRNLDPNTTYTYSIGTAARSEAAVTLATPQAFTFTTAPSAVAGEAVSPTDEECPPGTTPPADTTAPPAEEQPARLSFATDIRPIAVASCDGCHGGMPSGAMANYQNVMTRNWVVPNNADESPYYRKGAGLVAHGGGDAWGAHRQLVRDWIMQGAPE